MDEHQDRQWFLIRTKPRREELALLNYEKQGFSVYLPQIRTVRRHARRTEEVRKPFFPGYLFLHLAPEERRWPTIAATIGALAPVRFGDYYPPVPDFVIQELHEREDATGVIPFSTEVAGRFSSGEAVRIARGSREGLFGIFKKILDKDRVLVLLDILQRQVPVVVPAVDIKPAGY